MKLSTHFELINFHDANIMSVRRENQIIEILFDFVEVAPEHPLAKGEFIRLIETKLSILNVKSEKALIWNDDKIPRVHPSSSAPINEVMHGEQKENYFHFDGFWQAGDWSEWYIYANAFEIRERW